jgi:hypothetical protein
MNSDDRLPEPENTAPPKVPRRKLLTGLGSGVVTLLTAPVGIGMLDPSPASAAEPDVDACLDACERSDRRYVAACERAFREDVAAVEAQHRARLDAYSEKDGDEAAYRAACDRERDELLERVHASRRDWLATRSDRRAELLRSCGVHRDR